MFENARPRGEKRNPNDGEVPSLQNYALKAVTEYSPRAKETIKFNKKFHSLANDLERIDSAYSYAPCDLWLPKKIHSYEPESHVGTWINWKQLSQDQIEHARENKIKPNLPAIDEEEENEDHTYAPTIMTNTFWKCESLEIKFSYFSKRGDFFVITCEDDPFHSSHPLYDFRRNLKSHESYAVADPTFHVQFLIRDSDIRKLSRQPKKYEEGISVTMVQSGLGRLFKREREREAEEEFWAKDKVKWHPFSQNVLLKDGDPFNEFQIENWSIGLKLMRDREKDEFEGCKLVNVHYLLKLDLIPLTRSAEENADSSSFSEDSRRPLNLLSIPLDWNKLKSCRDSVAEAKEKKDTNFSDLFAFEDVALAFFSGKYKKYKNRMNSELSPYYPNVYEKSTELEREEMLRTLTVLKENCNHYCDIYFFWALNTPLYTRGDDSDYKSLDQVTEKGLFWTARPMYTLMSGWPLQSVGYGKSFSNKHVKAGKKDYVYFVCSGISKGPVDEIYDEGIDHNTGLADEIIKWKERSPFSESIAKYEPGNSPHVGKDYGLDFTVAFDYADLMKYKAYAESAGAVGGGTPGSIPPEIKTEIWGTLCTRAKFRTSIEPDPGLWNTMFAYYDGDRTEVYLESEIFHAASDLIFPKTGDGGALLRWDPHWKTMMLDMSFFYTRDITDDERVMTFELNLKSLETWKEARDQYLSNLREIVDRLNLLENKEDNSMNVEED